MPKAKKNEPFNPKDLTPQEQLKFEIAQELGLGDKVIAGGWRSLTAKESGKIGGLITKKKREMKREALEQEQGALSLIHIFEKQLNDDGTVIIKLFLYIDKKEQDKRFKKLTGSRENSWRVTPEDLKRNEEFDRYLQMNEEMLENTDTDLSLIHI